MAHTTLDLNGPWELSWHDGERGPAKRAGLHGRADRPPRQSFTATVPGEVHLDLIAAGVLPDPLTGLGCLASRWVEEAMWLYRRTFIAPALAPGERAWLCFERLELAAVVRLNGAVVGRHTDAFLPLCLDVTDQLVPGENLVAVEVEAGLFHASDRPAEGWGTNEAIRLTKRHWLRTVQSSVGWDWAQRLLNVGITGGVRLETRRAARAEGCTVLATLRGGLGVITVRGRFEVFTDEVAEIRVDVAVERSGEKGVATSRVRRGSHNLEVAVVVEKPELWWPVGHGEPRCTTAVVTLSVNGAAHTQTRRTVGFREIRVIQDPLPEGGRTFVIEVNGKSIFCKGADFVPADPIPARIDQGRYATLVDRALEAGFNMLRVWGGGLYESDDLYDLCDEKGLLVWQEFIFACTRYPGTDEGFMDLARREARHQVRRLAHHPSLVVWCGNNEIEWGYWSWGWGERGAIAPDHYLFHTLLPRVLAEEDGTRFYQPSSPWSPDLHHPNCDDCGDQHPWSVGFADKDFRKYREMICRFPNEGGTLGPASLPTVRACLVPGQEHPHSFAWELHENSIGGTAEADEILEDWLGRRIETLGIEDWVYLGGLLQGIGLTEYIRNFRRRMFRSAAAVFWMYNDCWPMVRSWTVVDYYLNRTPSFHPVRRAFAPLTVALAVEDGCLKVFVVNDGPAVEVVVRFGLVRLAGGYPVDQRIRLAAAGNASTLAGSVPLASWTAAGETTHAGFALLERDGATVAQDTLFLPRFHEMVWPDAKIRVRRESGRATFVCDTFAWRVCLDLDGVKPLADNFFDLLPGMEHTIDWREDLGEPRVLRLGNGETRRTDAPN